MLTRKTKKVGGNLHCIMAFKKLGDSASGQMFISFDRPRKTAAARRRDNIESDDHESTPSEDLESSDSDANDVEPKTEANVTSGLRQSREVWKNSFRALAENITSQEQQVVMEADNDTVAFEEVDTLLPPPEMQAREESTDRRSENRNRRSGTFTKREAFEEVEIEPLHVIEPAIKPPHSVGSTSAPDILVQGASDKFNTDRLKRTGTFTKKRPSLSPTKSDAALSSDVGEAVEDTSSPFEEDRASWANRTGTFTKKKPSLSPTRGDAAHVHTPRREDEVYDDLSPNVGTAIEDTGSTFEEDSPNQLKRSGTFKKKKSSLSPTRSGSSQVSRTQDYFSAELSHAAVEDTDSTVVDDHEVQASSKPRSGTFTVNVPLLRLDLDHEFGSDDDPNPFVRRGTFTKKKSVIPKSHLREQHTETDQDNCEPGLDDTLTDMSIDLEPDLDDTATHLTLEPPTISVNSSSDSEDSVEETLVLTDDPSPSGTRVKRSGTFTKTKPSLPSW